MIGFDPDLDYLFDPQQTEPIGFCPVCGREIYPGNDSGLCRRCLGEADYDD